MLPFKHFAMRKFIYLSLLAFSMMPVMGVSAAPAPTEKEYAAVCNPTFANVQLVDQHAVLFQVINITPVDAVFTTDVVQSSFPDSGGLPIIYSANVFTENPEVLPPLQLSRLITYGIRTHAYGRVKINARKSLKLTGNICAQNGRC